MQLVDGIDAIGRQVGWMAEPVVFTTVLCISQDDCVQGEGPKGRSHSVFM